MTFDPIVFGSYIVGTGFTDGSSITEGGFRVFIKPTANIGASPLDVGITYIDQFGNPAETTTLTTSVPAYTTAGTHIQVVLNAEDSGIRDITAVSVTGGTTGDAFNLESWNEGLGHCFGSAKAYPRLTPGMPNYPSEPIDWPPGHPEGDFGEEPTKETLQFIHFWTLWEHFNNCTLTNVLVSGSPDADFKLDIETIEPVYESNINIYGLMADLTSNTLSNTLKKIRADLKINTAYTYIDSNEQSTRFKWNWVTGAYVDKGLYKLTFDWDVEFNGTYFILELLNKDGTVVWSRTITGTGTDTVVSFISLAWEFRLRCVANYTSGATTTWHAQITNVRIERYKDNGTAEFLVSSGIPNIDHYDEITLTKTLPTATEAKFQLNFSDNNSLWSGFVGPDGTSGTYFTTSGQAITVPGGYTGFYYKWKVFLVSDGRYTPILSDLSIWMFLKIWRDIIELMKREPYPRLPANPVMPQAIPLVRKYPRLTPGMPNYPNYPPDWPIPYPQGWFVAETPVTAKVNKLGGILNTDTQIPYDTESEVNNFSVGDYIAIDQEIMIITSVSISTKTLTVLRGQKLTTAASHADDSIIYVAGQFTAIFYLLVRGYPRLTPGMPNYPADPPDWPPGHPTGSILIDTPVTALLNVSGGINTTVTSFQYDNESDPDNFSVGDYIILDNEFMQITDINAATNTLTITRAMRGTLADSHVDNTIIICPQGTAWLGRIISLMMSWSEATVGQVLSGWVRDQNESIIGGIKVIITSTYSVGLDQMGPVNPSTGFYQVFVKNTKYDGRLLVVELPEKTFDVVFRKYGAPLLIDGTTTVPSPQDLHFWKPSVVCGKSVAYVGSLVTY